MNNQPNQPTLIFAELPGGARFITLEDGPSQGKVFEKVQLRGGANAVDQDTLFEWVMGPSLKVQIYKPKF